MKTATFLPLPRVIAAALAAATLALPLAACDEGYGYGGSEVAVGWGSPYAYDGWYDGYYGPIYDGYWGSDGGFYYRSGSGDRYYRRGDNAHFRREWRDGTPSANWRRFQGSIPSRPQGTRMPNFPHNWHGNHR